jgi:hypothetical protein
VVARSEPADRVVVTNLQLFSLSGAIDPLAPDAKRLA